MRYAIVSDLHANLPAWRAVLRDLTASGADRILCLGDVIGYGPHPAEVLESVYAEVWRVALGNHDAALCGRMDASGFHQDAQTILEWTRKRLSRAALRLMATWPLQLAGRTFRCAHASTEEPARFPYLDSPEAAMAAWTAAPEPLLFVGHTHRPALYVLGSSGVPREVPPQDFATEEGKRYIVNVGSVGCPRDGDPRASYVIYDEAAGAVVFRRVSFDLDACRAAVAAAGLPEVAYGFLQADPLLGRRPLREVVSFQPPSSPQAGAWGAVEIEDVEHLRSRARRWRTVAAALGAALAAAAAAGGWWAWRYGARAQTVRAASEPWASARAAPSDANLLTVPSPGPPPFDGWTVRYGDRHSQSVKALPPSAQDGGRPSPAFRIESRTASDPVELISSPIDVVPGQRIQFEAVFDREPGFEGDLALGVALLISGASRDEWREAFVYKQPAVRRREGIAARETAEIPAGGRQVRVRLVGRFRGVVRVVSVTAARRS